MTEMNLVAAIVFALALVHTYAIKTFARQHSAALGRGRHRASALP